MVEIIGSVDEIKEENFVLIVKLGMRAPCRKLINECKQANGEVPDINFYAVDYVGQLKESLRVSNLPALVVFRNNIEVAKQEGWYITMPHIINLVKGALDCQK